MATASLNAGSIETITVLEDIVQRLQGHERLQRFTVNQIKSSLLFHADHIGPVEQKSDDHLIEDVIAIQNDLEATE